jgi:hypothetical protein
MSWVYKMGLVMTSKILRNQKKIFFTLLLPLILSSFYFIPAQANGVDPSGNRDCATGNLDSGAPDDGDPSTYFVSAIFGGYEVTNGSGYGCVGAVIITSGVTVIGTQAFYLAEFMTSIQIPNTVIEIGSNSFAGSGLTSINIPGSVTLMGDAAFQQMPFLTTVVIQDGITSLPSQAFYNNFSRSIVNLSLPNSLTAIGPAAFFGAGISTLYIPNSVTTIGDNAFEGSLNLSRVEIGSGVTTIGMNAFYDTNLLRLGEDSQKVQTVFYCGDPVAGGFFIDMDVLNYLYDLPFGADPLPINAAPPPICSEPAAPDLTAASTLSDTSVGLTFTAPTFTGGAPVTAYEVSIRNPTGEAVLFTQSFTPTPAIARGASSTFTVTNLTPATTYGFSLQAINALSGSYQSYLLTATTSNDAAQAAAAEAARVAAAAEAARKAKEQKELTEILAIIPKIAELTLGLGETTKSLYSTKCVKGKTTKYVKYGAKCPKGYKKK